MLQKSGTNKRLWLFFMLTYGFSWLFWIPQALAAHGAVLPTRVAAFLSGPFNPAAFGPFVAALVLTFLDEGWQGVIGLLKQGLDLRFQKIWLLAILLLPPVIFAGAILLSVFTGAVLLDSSVLSNPIVAIVAFGIILLTAGPLQEEFGWRGYALPRLQRHFNALVSSLVLGVLWWLWHLPLVFIPDKFMVSTPWLFGMLMVEMVLVTILFTWIYNNTGGSILATMLFHTSMNWSIWVALPSMKVNVVIVGFTVVLLGVAVVVVLGVFGPSRLSRNSG